MRLSSLSKAALFSALTLIAQALGAFLAAPFYGLAASVISFAFAGRFFLKHRQVLQKISDDCNACANGDMERRIVELGENGEMVELINSINRFIDVSDAYIRESNASAAHAAQGKFYRTIITTGLNGTWKGSATQLNDSNKQVRQNLIGSVRSAGAKLEAGVMQAVLGLSESVQKLLKTSTSLNDIASQSSEESETISASTRNVSMNISTIASAMEEMTATVKEISQQVSSASALSQEVTADGEKAKDVLVRLVSSSDKIGEVAQLIGEIAGQVNLLALNATIESARAGEAGKGFAVVASEVKSLANRTAQATKQVEQYIAQARKEVADTNETLSAILSKISSVNEASCLIAAAVEEQSATTMEISRSLQSASQATAGFAQSVDSMAQSAGQTKSASKEMYSASTALDNAAGMLKNDISNFVKSLENS